MSGRKRDTEKKREWLKAEKKRMMAITFASLCTILTLIIIRAVLYADGSVRLEDGIYFPTDFPLFLAAYVGMSTIRDAFKKSCELEELNKTLKNETATA